MLRHISTSFVAAAVLCTASLWDAAAAENADSAVYFQLPGGKKTIGKNPPNGTPPVITWRKKDFPTGFNIYPGVQDWTGYNALEMELIPDGTTMDFQIRVINQGLVFLYEIINLTGKETKHVVLPLSELQVNTKPVDLSKIRMVNFHRDNPPNSPEFELKIRDLKLRKLSDADLQKLREAKAAAAAEAERRAKAGETCNYFQFPGGKKTAGKNPPRGNPPEITWRRKDFPGGFNIYPGVQDWTGYNALEMDLVPDGNAVDFQIRVINQGLVFLYEIINLSGKETKHVVLPLKGLQINTKPVDLSKIRAVSFCRDNTPDTPEFTVKIRNLKLVKLPEAELKKLTRFRVIKGETGFRAMPEKTSLFKIPPQRVKEIAAMLPEKPTGLVPNYKDRNFWEKEYPACRSFISFGESAIKRKKLKKVSPDIFPEMLTSPKRDKRGERPGYHDWWYGTVYDCFRIINRLTIAECKENQGRFVPKIMEAMEVLLDMPTWDIDPKTLSGGLRYLESHSAIIASNLALSSYMLDDKLPADLRARIREKVDEWALTPAFKALSVPDARHRRAQLQGTGHAFWYDVANNMNPYFYNYLVQIAMVSLEPREQRAWIIANALEAMKCYFSRYTKDGYITEGMGYWFMGLGNALWVDIDIRQATGGRLSIFKGDFPGIKPLALGQKMTLIPGMAMYPHFGDHGVDGEPTGFGGTRALMFMNCDLAAGKSYYHDYIAGLCFSTYSGVILASDLPNTVSAIELRRKYPGIIIAPSPEEDDQGYFGRISPDYRKIIKTAENDSSNAFFANDQDCGILISRDYPESKQPFAFAVKGGNNGEGHGHDDCGSYCIIFDHHVQFGDMGVPVYYHATQEKSKQSYSHPVPHPAGTVQTRGLQGFSKVIDFKDSKDVTSVTYDLKTAYAVPSLRKLTRTAVHDRKARTITITDAFEFSQPETFETALTTYAPPKQLSDRVWNIKATRIEFTAKGGPIEFKQEKLDILMRNYKPVIRLACRFRDKVKAGEISYVISPDEEVLKRRAGVCEFFQKPGSPTSGRVPFEGSPLVITWKHASHPRGFRLTPGVKDWTPYNVLEFDLISDGSPVEFQFRAINQNLVFLYHTFKTNQKESRHFAIPLKDLKVNTSPVDLTRIQTVDFCREETPDTPDFVLKIRDLKLRKVSDAEMKKLLESDQK